MQLFQNYNFHLKVQNLSLATNTAHVILEVTSSFHSFLRKCWPDTHVWITIVVSHSFKLKMKFHLKCVSSTRNSVVQVLFLAISCRSALCILSISSPQNIKKTSTPELQFNEINANFYCYLSEIVIFFFYCKYMVVKNTVTSSTSNGHESLSWFMIKHQHYYPPLPLHYQCKCQHSEQRQIMSWYCSESSLNLCIPWKGFQRSQKSAEHTWKTTILQINYSVSLVLYREV